MKRAAANLPPSRCELLIRQEGPADTADTATSRHAVPTGAHAREAGGIEGRHTHTSPVSHAAGKNTRGHYSFSRLLWHIFPFTVYFFKTAHTQPLTEDEMTKTLYDVCRMTPPSQNSSHTHQNQTFPSKPTICAQLKMYVFSFI